MPRVHSKAAPPADRAAAPGRNCWDLVRFGYDLGQGSGLEEAALAKARLKKSSQDLEEENMRLNQVPLARL